MDFISNLPSEIFDHILRYLPKSDILNASVVSKQWYNHIADSKSCMRKIELYYYGQLDKDINPVLNSRRRYQNMIFSFNHEEFTKNRRIEKIFRLILNKFSDSIMSLETTHDTIRVSLPKLKCFTFDSRSRSLSQQLIYSNGILSTSSQGIYGLSLPYALDSTSVEIMKKFLQNMTELIVFFGFYGSIVNDWKSWFNGQFSLYEVTAYPSRTFVNEFLLEHRSTLKKVHLISTENLEFMLTNFPKLHTIIINSLTPRISQEFSINYTVKMLEIVNPPDQYADCSIIKILSKLKNLKILIITPLNLDELVAIFSLRDTLKLLALKEFEKTEVMKDMLKNLAKYIKITIPLKYHPL